MTETATGATYDPIPDLARLLCAAQRQDHPLPGLSAVMERLLASLSLPELPFTDEAEAAIRKVLAEHAAGGTIREGTKVKLIDPPGSKVPYGAVGIAMEEPDSSGLFWAMFPQGRMDVRVSEVEIVKTS